MWRREGVTERNFHTELTCSVVTYKQAHTRARAHARTHTRAQAFLHEGIRLTFHRHNLPQIHVDESFDSCCGTPGMSTPEGDSAVSFRANISGIDNTSPNGTHMHKTYPRPLLCVVGHLE